MLIQHVLDPVTHAVLGIVLAGHKKTEGISFVTKATDALQVGAMNWPAGHKIVPHVHKEYRREVEGCSEVLVVREGSAEVVWYDEKRAPITRRTVDAGDVLVIVAGGHSLTAGPEGFEAIEARVGPYRGADEDKLRFTPDESLLGQIDGA
jgi:mannose-6-phosphate isomerase-like protein (cupin superfamily)